MRKNTLVEYAKASTSSWRLRNEYGLRKFIEAVYPNWDNRCATCYALRFEETALRRRAWLLTGFTSTLFVSPYQNHELMRQICGTNGRKIRCRVSAPRLFRQCFREGQDKARELGLYMQNYCGCVFSEEDRYRKRKKKKPDDAQGVRRKSGCFGTIRPEIPRNNSLLQMHERLVYYIMYSRP